MRHKCSKCGHWDHIPEGREYLMKAYQAGVIVPDHGDLMLEGDGVQNTIRPRGFLSRVRWGATVGLPVTVLAYTGIVYAKAQYGVDVPPQMALLVGGGAGAIVASSLSPIEEVREPVKQAQPSAWEPAPPSPANRTLKVEVHEHEEGEYPTIKISEWPVGRRAMTWIAEAYMAGECSLSVMGLSGDKTRRWKIPNNKARRLIPWMVDNGFARWRDPAHHEQGIDLYPSCKAVFRYLVSHKHELETPPTPLPARRVTEAVS